MWRPKPIKQNKGQLRNGTWAASWQRWLHDPQDQVLFGGCGVRTRYIGVVTEREADKRAREFDTDHERRVASLRSLSYQQRVYVASRGGSDRLQQRVAALEELVSLGEQGRAAAAKLDPHKLAALSKGSVGGKCIATGVDIPSPTSAADWAFYKLDAMIESPLEQEERAELASAKAIALKVTPTRNEDSVDGLITVWQKVNPKSKTRKYIASLSRLKKFVGGNIAWRSLTRQQCREWRDALVKEYRLGSLLRPSISTTSRGYSVQQGSKG